MSNLVNHARSELQRAVMFDKEDDYDGMLADAVMELIELFAKQGHSGMSGSITLNIFRELANFNPLTPLTDNPAEWVHHYEDTWQSTRRSDAFSTDGGKTYYCLNERREWLRKLLPRSLRRHLPTHILYPMHKSQVVGGW